MRIAARQPYYKYIIIIYDKTTTIAVRLLNIKRVQSNEIPERLGLCIIYIITPYVGTIILWCPYGYRGSVRWKFKEQTSGLCLLFLCIWKVWVGTRILLYRRSSSILLPIRKLKREKKHLSRLQKFAHTYIYIIINLLVRYAMRPCAWKTNKTFFTACEFYYC